MRPTGANITHISQNLKGCLFLCPNAWYPLGVENLSKKTSHPEGEKVKSDAKNLGRYIDELRLKDAIDRFKENGGSV